MLLFCAITHTHKIQLKPRDCESMLNKHDNNRVLHTIRRTRIQSYKNPILSRCKLPLLKLFKHTNRACCVLLSTSFSPLSLSPFPPLPEVQESHGFLLSLRTTVRHVLLLYFIFQYPKVLLVYFPSFLFSIPTDSDGDREKEQKRERERDREKAPEREREKDRSETAG